MEETDWKSTDRLSIDIEGHESRDRAPRPSFDFGWNQGLDFAKRTLEKPREAFQKISDKIKQNKELDQKIDRYLSQTKEEEATEIPEDLISLPAPPTTKRKHLTQDELLIKRTMNYVKRTHPQEQQQHLEEGHEDHSNKDEVEEQQSPHSTLEQRKVSKERKRKSLEKKPEKKEDRDLIDLDSSEENSFAEESYGESQAILEEKNPGSLFPQTMEHVYTWKSIWKAPPREALIFLGKSILNGATFYRCHLAFFLFVNFVATVFLWLYDQIPFIDALFMSTSAITVTGLAVLDVAMLSIPSQLTIFFLMIIGGQVLMSLPLVTCNNHSPKISFLVDCFFFFFGRLCCVFFDIDLM